MAYLNGGYWFPSYTSQSHLFEPYDSPLEAEKAEELALIDSLDIASDEIDEQELQDWVDSLLLPEERLNQTNRGGSRGGDSRDSR